MITLEKMVGLLQATKSIVYVFISFICQVITLEESGSHGHFMAPACNIAIDSLY